VNVGGRNRLAMADLRSLVEAAGHSRVETYIQSGNVVFAAAGDASNQELADQLQAAVAASAGLRISVMVRSGEQLVAAVDAHPYRDPDLDPAKLAIYFLESTPSATATRTLEPDRFAPDRFSVIGDHLFAHYPNGLGRSKLNNDYIERRLGVAATARNLNTVLRLLDMANT
jgi:uncharacterized protein (DUF1697 family)